jgi:hypothetical protein
VIVKRAVEKMLVSLLLSALVLATKSDSLAASGEVIITHASMSTSAIPLWVAQRQNFFGKYGVKSKVVWGSAATRHRLPLLHRATRKSPTAAQLPVSPLPWAAKSYR